MATRSFQSHSFDDMQAQVWGWDLGHSCSASSTTLNLATQGSMGTIPRKREAICSLHTSSSSLGCRGRGAFLPRTCRRARPHRRVGATIQPHHLVCSWAGRDPYSAALTTPTTPRLQVPPCLALPSGHLEGQKSRSRNRAATRGQRTPRMQ